MRNWFEKNSLWILVNYKGENITEEELLKDDKWDYKDSSREEEHKRNDLSKNEFNSDKDDKNSFDCY